MVGSPLSRWHETRNPIEARDDYAISAQFTLLDLECRCKPIRSLFELSDEADLFGRLLKLPTAYFDVAPPRSVTRPYGVVWCSKAEGLSSP